MSPDRLAAGQAADSLVYHSLENRGSQIFLGSAVVDQRLDISFRENSASGGNGIKGLIVFCVFIKTGSVCLQKRRHLVDVGTCAAGADTVHTLFYVASFKIDDLGVLASKLNG